MCLLLGFVSNLFSPLALSFSPSAPLLFKLLACFPLYALYFLPFFLSLSVSHFLFFLCSDHLLNTHLRTFNALCIHLLSPSFIHLIHSSTVVLPLTPTPSAIMSAHSIGDDVTGLWIAWFAMECCGFRTRRLTSPVVCEHSGGGNRLTDTCKGQSHTHTRASQKEITHTNTKDTDKIWQKGFPWLCLYMSLDMWKYHI